jgi:hypothetical protein
MSDDLAELELDGHPPIAAPLRARDRRPRLTVAGSPCLIAEVEAAAARAGLSTMEWCRQSWQASLDGYPELLPEHGQRWVERQARSMDTTWADALGRLVEEVARRYPRGVRLP